MMGMLIIGIAGGSGAGKSTVSYSLVDADPDRFEVLNLDDYQKVKDSTDLPMMHGMVNWDHPDAVNWPKLRQDIEALREGHTIHLDVWAHRSNPDYAQHKQLKSRTIYPKPVVIVEGYLALYKEAIDLYDKTFYLDLDADSRFQRRLKARGGQDLLITENEYPEKVLKPMHQLYVEPTKHKADVIIAVQGKSVPEITKLITNNL